MRQIMHELRASYIDTEAEEQTLQNCFNHNITLENPGNFQSGVIKLVGTQTHQASNLHYIYVTSDQEFRFIVNGDEEIVGRHFSYMNLSSTFNILLENVNTDPATETSIKYLYGVINSEEE